MPSLNYPVFFFRLSNLFEYVKWEVSLICTDESHRHQRLTSHQRGWKHALPEIFEIWMFWNIISNVLRGQTLSKMFHFHAYFHVHDFAYKYSNLRSALRHPKLSQDNAQIPKG